MSLRAKAAKIGGALRKRIAVVVDTFDAKYQSGLIRNLRRAAALRRIELVVFPGGILGSDARCAPARNRLYDLVSAASVDGVILLSSTLSSRVGRPGLEVFCQGFRGLPLCSVGDRLDGVPSVLVDNERGIREMMKHLIEEHGHQRLAFIRGSVGNPEAEARYRAFCEELAAHGIEHDPALAPIGDFLGDSGRKAMESLLERPARLPQAVVACNDYMALGALETLARRKAERPAPIAVVGFDNIDEANFSAPPLSTIEQPLPLMAETAVHFILSQLQGESVPTERTLETLLVIRRSCGCSSARASVTGSGLSERPPSSGDFELKFTVRRQCMLAELSRASRGCFRGVNDWEQALLAALLDDLRGVPGDLFTVAVERLLRRLQSTDCEVWRFHDVISVLRILTLQTLLDSPHEQARAEDLFQFARLLTGEAVVRAEAKARLRLEQTARTINELGAALSICTDESSLRRQLRVELRKLGVEQAFVVLYAKAREPRRATLFYSLESADDAPSSRDEHDADQWIGDKLRQQSSGHDWLVLPLFFASTSLGFAVLDLEIEDGAFYEALRLQLSASLWHLLREDTALNREQQPAQLR